MSDNTEINRRGFIGAALGTAAGIGAEIGRAHV